MSALACHTDKIKFLFIGTHQMLQNVPTDLLGKKLLPVPSAEELGVHTVWIPH